LTPVPHDDRHTGTLWFAVLLTLCNGFLDAHTYLARGQVFANVQTANVIFSAIDLAERRPAAALAHVWPLLAFVAGMLVASHIRSGRAEKVFSRPLLLTMAVQSGALLVIGFVPSTVPHSWVTVPISFLAAVQIGLFRTIGDLAYMPVATTGNLMRFMEAAYDGVVDKVPGQVRASGVYGALIVSFASGALAGAVATNAWGVHAVWVPAAVLAGTLVAFLRDESRGRV
jgi:uncharacterized membrane protein YoaK (UPF0700 family)